MNKLLSLLLFFVFISCNQKQDGKSSGTPVTKEDSAKTTKNAVSNTAEKTKMDSVEIPATFKKLAEAKGDLDNDTKEELVVVYDTKKETDLGTERQIYIYRHAGSKWELWHKSTGAVLPSQHGGMMGDPFESLSIDKGVIVIKHFGGSREKWNYTHRYRFRNDNWYLIGATIYYGAPCDYSETYDFNLSTGKIDAENTKENCDEQDGSTKITKSDKFTFDYNTKNPVTMDGFYPGDNEVKIPGKKDKTFYF